MGSAAWNRCARQAPSGVPRWYACYTRSRHEKKAGQALSDRGFESYVPLLAHERQWKDRRKVVEFPMFPGYVFARFTEAEAARIVSAPGVCGIVQLNGAGAPIPEAEIESVRRFAAVLRDCTAEAETAPMIAEGERVRVMSGPFEGVTGTVVQRRGRTRLLIGVAALGHGLEVDVGDVNLAPLAEDAAANAIRDPSATAPRTPQRPRTRVVSQPPSWRRGGAVPAATAHRADVRAAQAEVG